MTSDGAAFAQGYVANAMFTVIGSRPGFGPTDVVNPLVEQPP